jgi:hypothetical protein
MPYKLFHCKVFDDSDEVVLRVTCIRLPYLTSLPTLTFYFPWYVTHPAVPDGFDQTIEGAHDYVRYWLTSHSLE